MKIFLIISILFMQSSLMADDASVFNLSLRELLSVTLKTNQPKGIFFSQINPPSKDSINIGILVPFSKYQRYSVELIAAVELAVYDINSQGGILGKNLVLIRADTADDADLNVELAREMIEKYNVRVMLPEGSSSIALRVAREVTLPTKTPMFLSASNANQLSQLKDNDLIFRLPATNKILLEKMLEFIQQHTFKRVAVFYERNIFGRELAEGLESELATSGATLVHRQSFSHLVDYSSYDLSLDIAKAQKVGTQIIVLPMQPDLLKGFFNQLNKYWKGELPVLLLPEHQFTQPEFIGIKKSERAVCAYALTQEIGQVNSKLALGLKDIMSSSHSSFTSVYLNDITYLIASALIYSEITQQDFSRSIRQITMKDKQSFRAERFKDLESLISQSKDLSFEGGSGKIHFDHAGDNTMVKITIKQVDKLYGENCGR